jgi:hypothetical protein
MYVNPRGTVVIDGFATQNKRAPLLARRSDKELLNRAYRKEGEYKTSALCTI